jgi:hypothetical protein
MSDKVDNGAAIVLIAWEIEVILEVRDRGASQRN